MGSVRPVSRSSARVVVGLVSLALVGCGEESLAPPGQVLLVVDTDLPLELASRLQVDFYAADGRWFQSRSIPRAAPEDWPVSFGVVADDDKPHDVLVRLRVHPDDKVRDYLGERYEARPTFSEPLSPHSTEEMCATAPPLQLGVPLTLRRAHEPFLSSACAQAPIEHGAVAAYVDITTADTYRFEARAISIPAASVPLKHTHLEIRAACEDGGPPLFCDTGYTGGEETPPNGQMLLEPGRYYLVAAGSTGFGDGPADVTLKMASVDAWDDVAPLTPEAPPSPIALYLSDDPTSTPPLEPMPSLTVDRLLRINVDPNVTGRVQTTLRGVCLGTQARLGTTGVSFAEAMSCVEAEGVIAPVGVEPVATGDAPTPASAVGSFGATDACAPTDSTADVACVPGGMFLFGSSISPSPGLSSTAPERLAIVPKFWVDRLEMSIARYRQALFAGFPGIAGKDIIGVGGNCNWDSIQGGNEDHGIRCMTWYGARAVCQFLGGDLPTEAQWEYLATRAGKPFDSVYPWGDDPPSCSCDGSVVPCHSAVFGRLDQPVSGLNECVLQGAPVGSQPVGASFGPMGDENPLGVVGLGGGLIEWTLDSIEGLQHPCWASSSMFDRRCPLTEAPARSWRGGAYTRNWLATTSSLRGGGEANSAYFGTGFRCVYTTPPGAP